MAGSETEWERSVRGEKIPGATRPLDDACQTRQKNVTKTREEVGKGA